MKAKLIQSRPIRAAAALMTALAMTGAIGAQTGASVELVEPSIVPAPAPNPSPVLRAADIREETPHHDVRLYFPWWPGLDESTVGDGDIVARGPNGYLQAAAFVSLERLPLPFPVPLTTVAEGDGDIFPVPQPHPILVATYRFHPPEGPGDLWTSDDNGGYGVRLVAGEILTENGRPLPGKFLGGFRCVIASNPGRPIQPEAVRIAIKRHPLPALDSTSPEVGFHALVHMFFRTPHVRVDWGDVARTGNTLIANAQAVRLPWPGPDPGPVPLPMAGATAIDPDGLPPGEVERPVIRPVFRHRYDLGPLGPGEYRFIMRVNGVEEGERIFVVPPIPPIDEDPPEAELSARNITHAFNGPQRMGVTYKDRSGVDVSTIGDGDLVVFSPCLFMDLVSPIPCNWRAQRARLVEITSLSSDRTVVKAVYEIDPPQGGWTHVHNGFYPVVLWEDAVCDRLGNCVERQRLGGFEVAIDPSDPPVPAEAEVRVDAGNPDRVKAKVHIDFKEHWTVVDQEVRWVGSRIYLLASAERLPVIAVDPPPPPPSQDLVYEIGPLEPGEYVAAFIMNRHLYDAEEFKVKRQAPIPADVTLAIDATDPSHVFADVKIQFRTPHRVGQGAVERQGHRILLPAKAEPLPVPLDTSIMPPVPAPVRLRYEIGALSAGGYIGAFIMNEYPYAVEDFVVEDSGPPIPAEVKMAVDASDPTEVVAQVKIRFRTPHVIVDRDLHRIGNRFLLEASARPILSREDPSAIVSDTVTLRYPLGALEPGDYGAAFVMNGYPYAAETWSISGPPFEADVDLAVKQTSGGNWNAHAGILFRNPRVVITDPGTPVFTGHVIMINATAEIPAVTPRNEPPARPIGLDYDLGELRPGVYWVKYLINGRQEAQIDFFVKPDPPVPADVDLSVDSSVQPVIATATIRFRDHYRIVDQGMTRIGNLFLLRATADGPLPIMAPIPPPPIDLTYELGNLRNGPYFAAFLMNGHVYDVAQFRVHKDGFEAEVDVSVAVGDEVVVTAVVDIDDPYVIVTDPGIPVINGNLVEIHATAQRVVFIVPPSGDPQTFEYKLGAMEPGPYRLVYHINGEPEAQTRFFVPDPPDPPLPHISHIRISQGNVSWFAEVGVILLPGQEVTDWGVVRRSNNEFHVNITVEWVRFPPPPVPLAGPLPTDPALPEGIAFNPAGTPEINGYPIRLVTHDYVLGVLDPGKYGFLVHSRGQTVARKAFEVPGSGPEVVLSAANITEATDEYRFGISYHDPDGLDHDSIMNAEVVVRGPDNYREVARLLSYASTDDVPRTGASARYAVDGPEGSWDRRDNGRYCVVVDPAAIRDLNGNHIENGRLGCFGVRIAPDPPDPGVNVTVAMTASGTWAATVEVLSEPGRQIVVDSWEPLIHFGRSFVALATVHLEPTGGPVEPLAHTYDLGMLQPGNYIFVFKTNLAHCGFARFTVPGIEGDPLDNWQALTGAAGLGDEHDGDADRQNLVGEYFFALDPTLPDAPDVRPVIRTGNDGLSRLGVRFRRLNGAEGVRQIIEASRHLDVWEDVSDAVDLVAQTVDADGTEEVVICLRNALVESPYNFLRVRVERDRD